MSEIMGAWPGLGEKIISLRHAKVTLPVKPLIEAKAHT